MLNYCNLLQHIENNDIHSINICGSPASGKSTLAKNLADDLQWTLIDLDEYLYHENCKRKSVPEDILTLSKLLCQEDLIIDGTYTSSLSYRVNYIDLFILTSSNRWKCLLRFILRLVRNKELKCGERMTWKTLELILKFTAIENNNILTVLPAHKAIKFKGYE